MSPRSVITVHYMGAKAKKYCYTVMYDDQSILTTVTADPDVVTEWIEGVGSSDDTITFVGFEIEIDFRTLRIGTLQLCLVNRCLVIQLIHNLPPSLVKFLGNPNIVLVGSHVGSKIGLLRACFPFQPCLVQGRDFLGYMAFLIDRKKTELASLGFVESDWDRLPLTLSVGQAHYACLDTFINLRFWEPLPPSVFLKTMLPFLRTSITRFTPHEGMPGDNKDMYDIILYGQTIWITVTAHLNAVREWIEALHIVDISFEVEFDINTGRVGTMQLFAGSRCLVFRLLDRKNCPPFLEKFLTTHAFAGGNDMLSSVEALRRQFKFKGKVVRVDIDENIGARVEFGKKKSILESIGLGNGEYEWGRASHLTDKEVHYACIRVFLNLFFALKFPKP